MAVHPLEAKQLLDGRLFTKVDPMTATFILNYMVACGYVLSEEQADIELVLPTWYKSAWRPASRQMGGVYKAGKIRIWTTALIHEALHSLLSDHNSGTLRGYPGFTLLSEAIASCSEIYFLLTVIGKLGLNKTTAKYYASMQKIEARHGRSYLRLFNKAAKDPYKSFKQAVSELNSLYLLALKANDPAARNFKGFQEAISKMELFPFISNFDIGNNILFVQANCGPQPIPHDQIVCQKIWRILDESELFVDFLGALERRPLKNQA